MDPDLDTLRQSEALDRRLDGDEAVEAAPHVREPWQGLFSAGEDECEEWQVLQGVNVDS